MIKYNTGKRPLSLLLGWGAVTITRYLDGDIPTKSYSDKLKLILNDTVTGASLFEDDCEAWVHGPVFRYVYDEYREFGRSVIEVEQDEALMGF